MSKIQLKKFLTTLTAEQLREVIIDAYSANGEIKRYFEFFLNPDVKKEKEKARVAIYKKFFRSNGSYVLRPKVKATTTIVKDFLALVPEPHAGADLMIFHIEMLLDYATSYYCTSSLCKSIAIAMKRLAQYLEKHGLKGEYSEKVYQLLSATYHIHDCHYLTRIALQPYF